MAYRKPSDYDDVKVGGDYKVLPAGGYICRILKAEECTSKNGNKPMLKVAFDICSGEYTGYFMEQFQNHKATAEDPTTVKWPFSGTKWVMFLDSEGKTNKDFKAFCTALEESGTEVWRNDVIDASSLKDAEIGILFRREEQEYMNQVSWRTVPFRFRSVRAIEDGDFRTPEDKPLPAPAYAGTGFAEVDSFSAAADDIPFK